MVNSQFRISEVSWHEEKDRIMMIRNKVFVVEQNVPMDEEIDGLDDQCWFVIAEDKDGNAAGTGRLLPTGKIGRMAVLKAYRNQGIGSAILEALIRIASEQSITDLYLHGQAHATAFYNKHGFVVDGQIFYEAEIPHYKMRYSPQS